MSWWKRRYRYCWDKSLWFPTTMARCSWRLGAFLDAHRDSGIIGCSSEDITRHSGAWGLLLDACEDREHCHILKRGWDIARCLQGSGALSGACRTWDFQQMLLGTISISLMLAGTRMFADAHRDRGHPLGAHGDLDIDRFLWRLGIASSSGLPQGSSVLWVPAQHPYTSVPVP